MPRKSREPAKPAIQRPGFTLAPERQQQITGLILAGVGTLSLLSLVSVSPGSLTDRWASFLRSVFGWGAFVVAGIMLWIGADLFQRVVRRGGQVVSWEQIAALEATLAAGLGLLHMWALPQDPLALAESGGGGGYVGWALSRVLSQRLTPVGAMTVFLFVILGSQAMIGQKSPLAALARWLERLAQQPEVAVEPVLVGNPATTTVVAGPAAAERPVAQAVETALQRPGKKGNTPAKPRQARQKDASRPDASRLEAGRRMKDAESDGELPPLSLLEPAAPLVSKDADNRARAETIESTLASFGVPARVVQINYGPTITQFGVEPQFMEQRSPDGETRKRKVRVSRITSLSNDLALALAAPSIRIEAPVPGRPYVGIEVPNSKPSLVSMRLIMESDAYQRHPSRLKMTLGQDVAGNPVVADLATMPHCLIAGATGSGKSVCVNSMIASLLFNNTPQELQMILVDPKRVELTGFNGVPHLIAPVVVETEKVVGALRWVVMQMDQRYREFENTQARNITQMRSACAGMRLKWPILW
ncbi:MAG: DNA translocase FtsK 4TM domain-containing protein [Chloroflexi bacterium]|nr:DNA translocase FtsK 4TM domain-containing protein [Chloroflexota bacterium]